MKTALILLVRSALAGLFIYAGIVKMMRPDVFFGGIMSYRLVPAWAALGIAYVLAPLELLCGLALLWERTLRAAALLGVAMMCIFMVAILSAWLRGLDISCGCFGGSGDTPASYSWLITRDVLFLLGFIIAAFPARLNFKKSSHNSSHHAHSTT